MPEPSLRYHLGLKQRVARSTLADANETRDWRVFAALAEHLMVKARRLYAADPSGVEGLDTIYALDASLIDPSWHCAAVKLHTLLDLRGGIPAFVRVTAGNCDGTAIFAELPIEPGSYYLTDRGYQDFATFHRMHRQGAFFVTRAKCNVRFTVCESRAVDKASGLRCDQLVQLANRAPRRAYPERLRRIRHHDAEHRLSLVFRTNRLAGLDHRAAVSPALAGRTIFQMDNATSELDAPSPMARSSCSTTYNRTAVENRPYQIKPLPLD